jgi:hypothetical protein
MSVEIYVFVGKSRIPDRATWQAEIEHLRFPLALHANFDPSRDSGYRPVEFRGKPSGFEFFLDSTQDLIVGLPHLAPKVASLDVCASFRWGGDLSEMFSALAAAASLAKLTDGVFYDPQDDSVSSAEDAVANLRRDLESIN